MAHTRHKRADHARRLVRTTAVVAGTVAAVTAGVILAEPLPTPTRATAPVAASLSGVAGAERLDSRRETVNRRASRQVVERPGQERKVVKAVKREGLQAVAEAERVAEAKAATRQAIRQATTKLWTTENLRLWTESGESAREVGLLESGEKVLITGRRRDGREELVIEREARWVTAGYLTDEEPVIGVGGVCENGSSVPSGVSPNIAAVHAAVCSAFPEITSYGTFRGDGEHAMGIAVDIMVSGDRGWQVAEFVRANAAALGVNYVIYSQSIWSGGRGGEGWRGMSDRGSPTANHYDHVHVTTY